jgi:hypothetical protein
MQRRKHLFQMIGAAVEVIRLDLSIDRREHCRREQRPIRCVPAEPHLWTSAVAREKAAAELP